MRQGRCSPSRHLPGWTSLSPSLSPPLPYRCCLSCVPLHRKSLRADVTGPLLALTLPPRLNLAFLSLPYRCCFFCALLHRKMCNSTEKCAIDQALSTLLVLGNAPPKIFFKIPSLYNSPIKKKNSILLTQLLILAFALLKKLEKDLLWASKWC